MNARQSGGAYDASWVEGKLSRLMDTFEEILERSVVENKPTHLIADAIAEARIKAAGDLKAELLKAA
jgi:leucine dehydrogenase